MTTGTRVRIATRGSALAQWQANYVADRLIAAHPDLEVTLVIVDTVGDRHQEIPVWEMSGQGVFVKEVQAAVLAGRADIAVHSAKDLPSITDQGLWLACVPVREDPRDALVGMSLDELPTGARVATGSVRRRAQLAGVRPDLHFSGLRGNIATRVAKASEFDAIVVAAAAMHRLGLEERIAEILDVSVMLPQVGQGALAVECRATDEQRATLLAAIDAPSTRREVEAERAFLARLGGGCDLPVGAYATEQRGIITIEGMLASLDGRVILRDLTTGPSAHPGELGASLAARLLNEAGGSAILDDLAGGSQG
jgi:hydroxymethylbilane synthase